MMCTLCVQGASVSLQWDFLNVITLISGKKYFNELETLQIGSNPDKLIHLFSGCLGWLSWDLQTIPAIR